MFNNPLENETYTDSLISNNANILDTNVDIITPNNLDIDSISNAIDSLFTAKNLGTLSDKQQHQGNVSPIDRRDFYHFSTDKVGDLDYRLTGLSSNANIQLLDSNGDMLSGSFNPGKANEYEVHHNLPAGDYYLKVYGYLTEYNLDVELLGDPDAMNSLLTAKDLGTISDKQTQQGTVSKEDRLDLYHFRTEETGDLEYKVTGLSSDANIQLLDSDGDLLSGSFNPGTVGEHQVHQDLEAGEYYLKVYGGDTNYTLDFGLLGTEELAWLQKLQEFQEYIVDSGEDFLVGLLSQWGRNNGSEIFLQFSDPTFVQEFEQLSRENNWVLFGRGVGDIASIVQSLAEISAGGTISGGGVAAAPASGGTSLVLTASGALVIAHGTAVGNAASADLGEIVGELSDDLTQQIFAINNSGDYGDLSGQTGSWAEGSYSSPQNSLLDHFRRHGDDVRAKDPLDYLNKAEEFKRTAKKRSRVTNVIGATPGVKRYSKNGKYIDLTPDGRIISFGSNE